MTTKNQLAEVVHLKNEGGGVFEVVINRGRDHGVKDGDKYIIFGIGPSIQDPSTGEDLGVLELVRGRGIVTHAQERMSHIRCTEKGESQRRRIVKKGNPLSAFLLESDTVEEEFSASTLPFNDVAVGDKAKKLP